MRRVTMREIIRRTNAGEPLPAELEAQVARDTVATEELYQAIGAFMVDYARKRPELSSDVLGPAAVKYAAIVLMAGFHMTPEDVGVYAHQVALAFEDEAKALRRTAETIGRT